MGYLPDRPLRLKKGWAAKRLLKGGLWLALGLALGLGGVVYGAGQLRDRLAARRVWATGEEAQGGNVHGKVQRHTILGLVPFCNAYELEVTFQDREGRVHVAKLDSTSFIESADTEAHPEIRYQPADPSRVELSWFAGMRYGLWAWPALLILVGLLVAWGLAIAFKAGLEAVRSAEACGRQSEELEVKVVALAPVKGRYGSPTGKWSLRYELPASPLRRPGPRAVTLDGPPIAVPGRPDAVLALLSRARPAHPTFPLQDLSPFEVSAAERAAFEQRLGRASAG